MEWQSQSSNEMMDQERLLRDDYVYSFYVTVARANDCNEEMIQNSLNSRS